MYVDAHDGMMLYIRFLTTTTAALCSSGPSFDDLAADTTNLLSVVKQQAALCVLLILEGKGELQRWFGRCSVVLAHLLSRRKE